MNSTTRRPASRTALDLMEPCSQSKILNTADIREFSVVEASSPWSLTPESWVGTSEQLPQQLVPFVIPLVFPFNADQDTDTGTEGVLYLTRSSN